jgi:hypothetical protein
LPGLAVQQIGDVKHLGSDADQPLFRRSRNALHSQAEGHVVAHAHMRIERIGLEHHRDIAVLRLQPLDRLAVEQDAAAGRLLQARDHS